MPTAATPSPATIWLVVPEAVAEMPTDLPRFVPTLTEVVEEGEPLVAPAPSVAFAPARPQFDDNVRLHDDIAEQIAHRVLQRVDAALEDRLAATIRAAVERHTEALLPTLREEIVAAVQDTVAQALAEEFIPPEPALPR